MILKIIHHGSAQGNKQDCSLFAFESLTSYYSTWRNQVNLFFWEYLYKRTKKILKICCTLVKWIQLSEISEYLKNFSVFHLTLLWFENIFFEFLENCAFLLCAVLIKSFFLLLQALMEGDFQQYSLIGPPLHIRQHWVMNTKVSKGLLDDPLLRSLVVQVVPD